MCKILSLIFDLDYLDMIKCTKVINTEYPRNNIKIKSSMSDAVYRYKNKIFIIEMNKTYTKESLYKNHFYLFYRHIFDAKNENTYNSEIETYLIDIDNFNILNKLKVNDIKEDFIYENREIYPIFDEEKFHENEKKEMYNQGIEVGLEQGMEKGQNKKQLEIVKKLLNKKYSKEEIMDITGLSKYQINNL